MGWLKPKISEVMVEAVFRNSDCGSIGSTELGGRCDQRIEHSLQIEGRTTDDLEHIGRCDLLLKRLTQFVEQPRVLYGDDSLGREVLHQLDLLVREWPYLLPIDDEGSQQL
jgi:hypothetical protein